MTCTEHRAHCGWCRSHSEFSTSKMPNGKWPEVCPEGFTTENLPEVKGIGSLVEKLAKPIAKALGLPCLDKGGNLNPASPCGRRRDALNG